MNDIFDRVKEVVEKEIRPLLHDHKGDIELIAVLGDTANVKFLGACKGCPGAQMTINGIVQIKITEKVPEIKKVILKNDISEDMISMAKKILNKDQ